LAAYQEHPDHKSVKPFVLQAHSERRVVDYEVRPSCILPEDPITPAIGPAKASTHRLRHAPSWTNPLAKVADRHYANVTAIAARRSVGSK